MFFLLPAVIEGEVKQNDTIFGEQWEKDTRSILNQILGDDSLNILSRTITSCPSIMSLSTK